MAKFTLMDPRDVMIGRERSAREARQPYVSALGKRTSEAGERQTASAYGKSSSVRQ